MIAKQKILVTGAAAGFGFRIATTLANAGHTVFATLRDPAGRNASKARALAASVRGGGKLYVLELDVADDASVDAAVRKAAELEGGLDAVINNAGVGPGLGAYGETVGMDQFRHAFEVNVFGVQRVTRAALPYLRERGRGLIVNISSTMGRIVLPYASAYTASKYALEGLSESYRYELSATGVEVAIVEPGGFPTDFFASVEAPSALDRLAGYGPLADAPAKFWGPVGESLRSPAAPDPQAVADAVLDLVAAAPGSRPLRVVVDPLHGGEGPRAINQTTGAVQAGLLEAIGQKHLLVLKGLD
ncbi:MAG: SDR family oxidoreductase [Fibrobacteres bacterium]|nr:SDR family oxidoreductase [Fibrobacterota bacterium]